VGNTRNSFVFKILTSNSYGLKILQTLFAKPAPVKPFQGVGGRGVSLTTPDFPKWNTPESPSRELLSHFFSRFIHRKKLSPHA
jgi:hypothetical protein